MTPTELRKIAFGSNMGILAENKEPSKAIKVQERLSRIPPSNACRSSIFIGFVIGLSMLLVGSRNSVVDFWSPSANIFAFIGAPVNLRGLEITNLRSVLVEENGIQTLIVEGDIKNVAVSSLKVPELDMNIRGIAARTLYSWRAPSPRSTLGKGETMTFRTRLSSPPDGAAEVRVQFTST